MDAAARPPRFNLRFSLKGAIFLMAAVAVGAAAFRDASKAWMTVCTSVALAAIFFAAIVAMYGHRDRKAFWTGFAICSATYFLFAVRFKDSDIVANLATTKVIYFITDKSHPYLTSPYSATPTPQSTRVALAMLFEQVTCYWNMRVGDDVANDIIIERQTAIIGHCQCTLVLGFLGGLLAQCLAAGGQRTRKDITASFSQLQKKEGTFNGAA